MITVSYDFDKKVSLMNNEKNMNIVIFTLDIVLERFYQNIHILKILFLIHRKKYKIFKTTLIPLLKSLSAMQLKLIKEKYTTFAL